MIFVTLGSQKFQFNRLLKKIDELLENGIITENIFAQTGTSNYCPVHYPYKPFLDREAFSDIMKKCDIVITHGGTGTIIKAVKLGKKVIAVPRLAKYKEHVDDHQIQLVKEFDEMNLICPCIDIEKLPVALETVKNHSYNSYHSNTSTIIKNIESYLNA